MKCDLLDKISFMSEHKIFKGDFDNIPLMFRVNKDKIDFDKLEKMKPFEQEKESIILEEITNLKLYIDSKFKKGYEDYSLKLSSKITSHITSFKEV